MMTTTTHGLSASRQVPSVLEHAATLCGRQVVVTGVSGGIGLAIAIAFAAAGAGVIGLDVTEQAAADALATLPASAEAHHAAIGADFTDPVAIATAMGSVRSISKDIAALVNVAGIADDQSAQLVTQASLDKHLAVNFKSALQASQYVSRLMMRSGGGSIVNISSVTGIVGNPGQLAYGATKAALNNATIILSMELASRGIRVNAIAPGVVDTAMTRNLGEADRRRLLARVGMGRPADPAEIASVALWLCTPAASFVTGQVIRVDGAML